MVKLDFYENSKATVGNNKFLSYTVEKTNNKNKNIYMKQSDLEDVLQSIDKQKAKLPKAKQDNFQFLIRGLAPVGWRSIKSFSKYNDIGEYNKYMESKVSEESEVFSKFAQLEIIIKY